MLEHEAQTKQLCRIQAMEDKNLTGQLNPQVPFLEILQLTIINFQRKKHGYIIHF